jgi:uncharacterized protein
MGQKGEASPMATHVDIARRLYRALEDADVPALLALLHPRFSAEVTDGLPCGLGGRYDGPKAMLGLWARVTTTFDVRPRPQEFLPMADERVVVVGRYVGRAVPTRAPVDAAFVHILRIEADQILALQQITDSQRWAAALEPTTNTERVRHIMRAVSERDLDGILAHYAPDIEIHEAPSLPYGGVYRGHPGAIDHGTGYLAAWDPWQAPAERDLEPQVFGAESRVVALWRQKATRGDRRLDLPAVSVFEFRDDKVVRLRMFHFDTAAIARFLHGGAPAGPAGTEGSGSGTR